MVVLDCCAALAMASCNEEGKAISSLLLSGEEITAPSLLVSEMAHAVAKYVKAGRISEVVAQEYLKNGIGYIDTFDDDKNLAAEALSESFRRGHSSYDMFYLVLARRTGATLFTLDKKMWALACDMHVNCIEEADLRALSVLV